ncbi:hypothetical protein BT63DRAFT_123766 [Microthyrium microscopicum]|uniref:Zinc finger CHCC-type domain-containing protein n=1 Tax=Microthyrium microscopicum TaxID=703497 RepID=A0A6A6TV11_9PEZI|nr:hypothetical protein BT63DRAFT_123766 [Microthyrium microscopicum]
MLALRALRRSPAYLNRTIAPTYSTHAKEVTTNDPTPATPATNVSKTNATPTSVMGAHDGMVVESVSEAEEMRSMQAPNRQGTWSNNQKPREKAMVGPRFEQMIMKDQPQPYAAIDLIHKQPVRWRKERVVSCDGGGGPLGHPRIFINLDKPQVNECTYCGLPFALEHHRKTLESLPSSPYPLAPTGDPAEVPETQRITNEPLGQR